MDRSRWKKLIKIGWWVGGWTFLLVPADPGSPGQRATKRLLLLLWFILMIEILYLAHWQYIFVTCLKGPHSPYTLWSNKLANWNKYEPLFICVCVCQHRISCHVLHIDAVHLWVIMAKELTQRIIGTVQSGLNSTVHSLQAAVHTPSQGSAFYPTTLDQLASFIFRPPVSCLFCLVTVFCFCLVKIWICKNVDFRPLLSRYCAALFVRWYM